MEGGLTSPFAEVDEEELARFSRREGHHALGGDACAVARRQHEVAERRFSVQQMEPSLASRKQLVNDMLPEVEQGRIHERIEPNAERAVASVWRRDDEQCASAFRSGEALLFRTGLELELGRPQPELQDVGAVGPRRIRLLVSDA